MAFTRVQGNAADSGNNSFASISVTISAVGSGNAVCGLVAWDNAGSPTLTSVTDDKGNTYNLETTKLDTANAENMAAFSRTNITNAPVTITANFSTGCVFRKIIVDEFSGGSTASSDERDGAAHGGQFQNAPGTGTDAITSGTFTTTVNGDLLYGACVGANTTAVASNGTSFSTGTQNTSSYAGQSEYRVQATAGSGTAATFTQAVDTQRIAFLISIKAPAGGGAAVPNGWWRNESENLPIPPVRFHLPPAFVSTFRTAVVSGIAFARREPEYVPRPVRRFEPPPAWDPRVITPVVVTSFNGWFVNPGVLKKSTPPIDVPSVVLASPVQVPYGWFVAPEMVNSRPVFFERPISFVSSFQTAGIDGIAWMTPIDVFPFRRLTLNDPSQVYVPQQQVVVAVIYNFMFPDVYKLRPVPRDDVPAFGRPVDILTIGWFNQPTQDRYGLNIRMDTSPALSLTPATLSVPISGMAWFAPIENAVINRGISANVIAAWLPQVVVQVVSDRRLGVNRLRTIHGSSLSSLNRRVSRKI